VPPSSARGINHYAMINERVPYATAALRIICGAPWLLFATLVLELSACKHTSV